MADDQKNESLPQSGDEAPASLDPAFPYSFLRFDPLLLGVDILVDSDAEDAKTAKE